MAENNYLDGAENLYGLPTPLPQGLGEQATAVVDNYLGRSEGLLYTLDSNGNACCMKAMHPSNVYTTTAPISPGQSVVVTVVPATVRVDLVGEVIILDRGQPEIQEAVVVLSTIGTNQLVLQNVQFSHSSACKLDLGCVIREERSLPAKRSIARFSKFPMGSVLSLMGRYGYGRRSDQIGGLYQEMNLLAAVQTFGGPPSWVTIPIAQTTWSNDTGEIWVPAGLLLAYYSDVKIQYVAGFVTAPDAIVRATSEIARAIKSNGSYGASIRSIAAGDHRIQRFASSNLDDDTKRLLEPFKARLFY